MGVKLGVGIGFKVLGVERQGVHPLGVKLDNLSQRHFPQVLGLRCWGGASGGASIRC